MMIKYFVIILLFLTPHLLIPQSLPITLNGEFDDWEDASVLFDIDDAATVPQGLHVQRLQAANDDRFLFLHFELDREITLLENNPIVLFVNTDNDSTTGYDSNNMGAELRWEFGERRGRFYTGVSAVDVHFHHIRMRTAPTVTSTEFEVAIGRNATPDGSASLFQSDTVRIYLRIEEEGNDSYAAGTYIFDPEPVAPPEPIPLERYNEDDLRVLAFNAWNDKVFVAEYTDQYKRMLNALDPDIIAFQEIWDHNALQTSQRVEELYPSGDEYEWHTVKKDRGNVTVSRFPILDSWQILIWNNNEWSNEHRLTVALIDAREKYDTKILFINVHLRAGSRGEDNRWLEIAGLTRFIDNARQPGGSLHLEEGIPIVLAGDFNLVGSRGQLEAIETDIHDWDDTGMERVRARQTEKRMHYTWRNDNSTFSPGKLDYIFYTNSVLSLKNHYTLQVEEMSPEQRAKYGLQYGDTQTASDHLPHVADFRVKPVTGVKDKSYYDNYILEQNYPNPFNPSTNISFSIPETSDVVLTLHDILGKEVKTILDATKSAGNYNIIIDVTDIASGVYYYTLQAGAYTRTKRMMVIR